MTREIEIRDKKTGQLLRETYTSNIPTLFGALNLTPADVMKFGGAILAVIVFFVNGQNDKHLMQANLDALQKTTARLVDFKENSDAWQTQQWGTRFRDGQPIDNNFRSDNVNRGYVNSHK